MIVFLSKNVFLSIVGFLFNSELRIWFDETIKKENDEKLVWRIGDTQGVPIKHGNSVTNSISSF